jgi:DNA-binding CsgD family transcriptional regulator
MDASIVGRDAELGAIERLLEGSTGSPALLELEGAPGMGKTTVWEEGCRRAREAGRTVLAARGAGAEVRLGYAALADLLADLDDATLAALPTPQRRALEAALLRGDTPGPPGDPRAVATALRSVLEALAAAGPVLLALDDLQWLDPSSADALRFAVRRLTGPVAVLLARREPDPGAGLDPGAPSAPGLPGLASPAPPPAPFELRGSGAAERLVLAPLPPAAIEALLRARAGSLSRTASRRIAEVAAGNPFIALELARTVDPSALAIPTELPAGLRELVDARLGVLDPPDRHVVLHAAMLTRPTVALVEAALEDADVPAALAAAEGGAILRLDGARIAFSHPLLATGAYAAATGPERREAHRRIAGVTSGEERARHLALASLTAEPDVIAALDAAAAAARERGASSDAAQLLELALRLGAADPERRQEAAERHLDAGDVARARELLEGLVEEQPPGGTRARALAALGTVHRLDDDLHGSRAFLERAAAEAEDPGLSLAVSLELAFTCTQAADLGAGLPHADRAVVEAEALGAPGLLAPALAVRTMIHFLVGEGVDEDSLRRSLELEDPDARTPGVLRPTFIAGLVMAWTGRHEEAHEKIGRVRAEYRERGAESDIVMMTMHLGTLACARGDTEFGRALIEETIERADQLGSPSSRAIALANQVEVAAWVGEVGTARRAAAEALTLAEQIRSPVSEMFTRAALGRLELSLGDHAAAAAELLPGARMAIAIGSGDPDTLPLIPDSLEALTALGRVEEATPVQAFQRRRADEIGRSTLLAVAARGDGQLAAAAGDLDAAEEALHRALDEHERLPLRFEVARTLLALGQVQRRRRRRAAARESLGRARELFEALGAVLWAARAAGELERIDTARSGDAGLTAAEERAAVLAAGGLTNREVAAELFVSPKTVEATLSRVYRKLGIRSRAELGGWLAAREADPTPLASVPR